MKHRTIRGKLLYLHDERGETGREWFSVTVQPSGERTVRAQCEMEDEQVLRDVVWTMDSAWRPIDAYVRLSVGGAWQGSGWFHCADGLVTGEIQSAALGRVQQRLELDAPAAIFGAHPVSGDAMKVAVFDRDGPPRQAFEGVSTSPLPNGASGPILAARRYDFEYLGTEDVTVPAGTFSCAHFRWHFQEFAPIDIWNSGTDCIPVKLRWDELESDYVLSEIDGDFK